MGNNAHRNVASLALAIVVAVSMVLPVGVSNHNSDEPVIPLADPSVKPAYVPHDPIRIDSNADFTTQGWSGSGTEAEPWVIEGYDIDGTDVGYCICIVDTTDYFIIRNCYLHDSYNDGIFFRNVINGQINYNNISDNDEGCTIRDSSTNIFMNNTFSNSFAGISLFRSDSNTITNNTILNSYAGIKFFESSNNFVINNSLVNNSNGVYLKDDSNNNEINKNIFSNNTDGIYMDRCGLNYIVNNTFSNNRHNSVHLSRSTAITIVNNTMTNCGMFLDEFCAGLNPNYWGTHDIDTSNTINGKPIYYWKYQSFNQIPSGAGQVILVGCNNIIIQNQDLNNGSVGIQLGFSQRITIYNVSSSDNFYGMLIIYTDNSKISNSTINNNWNGFYSMNCNNNTIDFNNISYNNLYGISISNSDTSIICNNSVLNNIIGIDLGCSHNMTIINNTINNHSYGIMLSGSNDNNILNNTILSNDIGICLSASNHCTLSNNTMNENGIVIQYGQLEQWISHEIDTSNKVNGKPVYYWKNRIDGVIPAGAGQVILVNCTNINVVNQNLSNASIGIEIGYSSNIVISNIVTFNNADTGIYLLHSNDNYITNNTISSNEHGLYLHESLGNYIKNISISNNEIGIYLANDYFGNGTRSSTAGINKVNSKSSINNIIEYNVIFNNGIGIELYNFYNYAIAYNLISQNSYGVYFPSVGGTRSDKTSSSPSSMIFHNNFINNMNQAIAYVTSTWDNGYPSGGNYWSDYTGIDQFSGPNQDQPGSDGIGDTPYIFDFTQDNYPLISPFDYTEFDIPLQQGWNLISLPLRQLNDSIESVLSGIGGKWDYLQTYETWDVSDPWKTYSIHKPEVLNDLYSMNHQRAYWLHVTEPNVTLTIAGDPLCSPIQIPLYAGWNLVGYPSLTNETVGNALWGTGADKVMVCDTSEPYNIKEVGPTYLMKPCEGYWVHVPADTIWVVDW